VPPEVERREVDGVIVRGTGPVVAKISSMVPTVTLDDYVMASGAYGVVPDYRGGVYEAVKKLIATGHEKIALLTGEPGKEAVSYSEMCREGAIKALEEGKVPVKNLITGGIVGTPAQGYKAGYEILKDRRERPDAIIASDGGMIGIYKAIYEWKMKIPENISCVGTDGVLYGEYLTPALTTVDVHIEELGAKATKALTDILLSGERKTGVEITPVTLVIRNSAKI
jgi:DNA-binding LacI/PurR family transcriptional regulator